MKFCQLLRNVYQCAQFFFNNSFQLKFLAVVVVVFVVVVVVVFVAVVDFLATVAPSFLSFCFVLLIGFNKNKSNLYECCY